MAYNSAALAVIHTPQPFTVIQGGAQQPAFTTSLFDSFIDYTDRKDSTIKGYCTCIRQFVKWLELNDIRQPQRDDIKAYRDYLTGSGLATGTQVNYLRAVKHFFKWTAAEGLYPNVADNIHGAETKRGIHRKDAFDPCDVLEIASTICRNDEQGKRLYTMFLLNFVDGLRTIELHRADVGDIKTIKGDLYIYIQGKGHDEKDTPKYLTPETSDAIKDYLQSRSDKLTPKSPLFVNTSNRGKPGAFKGYETDKDGNIIYDKNGKPKKILSDGRIATTTISTMFKDCFVNAGYDSDRLTAHSLRHTSGTGAYKATGNIYLAQKHQRHASPETTEIYIHAEEREERQTEQQVYNYYFGAENKSKAAEAAELLQTLDEAKLDKVLEFINLIK